MTARSTLLDRPDSYGWVSIGLHWTTAVALITLWFLGRSLDFQAGDELIARRSLHVTLGLLAWPLLAGRIYWRLKNVHPRAAGQSPLIHTVASSTHYLLLSLLAVMLVSGPLLAWSRSAQPAVAGVVQGVHGLTANLLALFVLLHVAGAMKHLMFDYDETLARIFVPRRATGNTDEVKSRI